MNGKFAIISDIHGNLTALEAVLEDIKEESPDEVLLGGDLCDGGSSPEAIAELLMTLEFKGVRGNGEELLTRENAFENFAHSTQIPQKIVEAVNEIADWTKNKLTVKHLKWLSSFPILYEMNDISLVHASPDSVWHSPLPDSTDHELFTPYKDMMNKLVIFGHIHVPFIRNIGDTTLVNTGSVGLPFDGDRRSSYLLVERNIPKIKRVEYNWQSEIKRLESSTMPHKEWIIEMILDSSAKMPN